METLTFSVPTFLRRFGAVTLIVAGASFLFEGWHTLTPLDRYLSFVGFSLMLALAGLFCGKLGEAKGARTFLALATTSLTAHFGQLGSAIFTAVRAGNGGLDSFTGTLPIGLVALGGILISIPFGLLGFATLQRSSVKSLSALYLGMNVLALIPVRGTPYATALLSAATVLFLMTDRMLTAGRETFSTSEGTLSRLIVGAPWWLLFFRAWMHTPDSATAGIQILLFAQVLFAYAPAFPQLRRFRGAIEMVSLPFFAIGWLPVAAEWTSKLPFDGSIGALFYGVPFAAGLALMSTAASPVIGRIYRGIAGYAFLASSFVGLAGAAPEATIATVIGSVLLVWMALECRERHPFVAGLFAAGFAFGRQILASMEFWMRTPWISLCILGLVTLTAAVVLEKYSDRVKARIQSMKGRFSEWH